MRLVLFGPPGAGKGTQAILLKDLLKVPHISSGDLFRDNLSAQTPLGIRASEYMNQGLLVPDELTIDIVLNKILSMQSDEGFILDGFPRNPNQAQVLQEALCRRSRGLDKVAHIDVPEFELTRRLSGRFICRDCQAPSQSDVTAGAVLRCNHCQGELYQRDDDKPEAVQRRIVVYRDETLPVLDYYQERGLLVEVSGLDSIEDVHQRLVAALD